MKNKVTYKHKVGDICIYKYGNENKSKCVVQIVRILKDERGIALYVNVKMSSVMSL